MAPEVEQSVVRCLYTEGGVEVHESPTVTAISLYGEGLMRLFVRSRNGETQMYRVSKVAYPKKDTSVLRLPNPV